MPEIIQQTVTIYTAEELREASPEGFERALADYTEDGLVYDWWNAVYDYWTTDRLPALGYNDATINFSGFWSQGDGASFVATVDLADWLKSHKRKTYYRALLPLLDAITARVFRFPGAGYVHEYTIDAEVYAETYDAPPTDKQNALMDELREEIRDDARSLSRTIYKELEAEWEYLTGAESFIETSEANDWRYTADGALWRE